jgi:hypothetical protein
MSNLGLGLMGGAVFGVVSVAMMLPMLFPDKKAALLAAFIRAFAPILIIGTAGGIIIGGIIHGWR